MMFDETYIKRMADEKVKSNVDALANKLNKYIEYEAAVKKTYDTFRPRDYTPQDYIFNADSIQFVKVQTSKEDICKYNLRVFITDYGVNTLQPRALSDLQAIVHDAQKKIQ